MEPQGIQRASEWGRWWRQSSTSEGWGEMRGIPLSERCHRNFLWLEWFFVQAARPWWGTICAQVWGIAKAIRNCNFQEWIRSFLYFDIGKKFRRGFFSCGHWHRYIWFLRFRFRDQLLLGCRGGWRTRRNRILRAVSKNRLAARELSLLKIFSNSSCKDLDCVFLLFLKLYCFSK